MTPKKHNMPAEQLALAQRCYRQAKTADALLECMKMHQATVRIWFDPRLEAWIIHDNSNQYHLLPHADLDMLPSLLYAQNITPGAIAILSGDDEGECIAHNAATLARIEEGQRQAAAHRDELRRGVKRPAAPVAPSTTDEDLANLFSDLL